MTRVLATAREIDLDPRWWSWSGPHGGHLLGELVRTAVATAPSGRAVRSVSAGFLSAAPAGPATASARVLRSGRTSTVVDARLATVAGTAVTARVVLGADRPVHAVAPVAPALFVPPPDACAPLALPVELVPFAQHLEYRPAGGSLPLSGGDRAELVAWARFVDGSPVDAARAVVLTDALPPALYGVVTMPLAVPTVDLAVTVVADLDREPVDDWVLLRIATQSASGGWCVDDSEVRSRDGRLLAAGRQTRLVLDAAA